jgi:hypothetical protein
MKIGVWTTHGLRRRECIWRRRGLAIHRAVGCSGWTLTHIPTGLSLGYRFKEVGDLALMPLIRVACFLAAVVDWREVEQQDAHLSCVVDLLPIAGEMFDAWNAEIGRQIQRLK